MKALLAHVLDGWHYLLYHLLRFAPVGATSAFGSALVRANVRFNRREIYKNALANVQRHIHNIARSDAEKIVDSYLDNVGRVMAEFSIIHRMAPRISISNLTPVREYFKKRPVLAIILHTGNWEMFGPALKQQGVEVTTFYEPPTSGVHRRIVEETRKKAGLELLSPDFAGMRRAISLLKQNKIVAIFGDEARSGVAMAPLFGRPPHSSGNLAIAAKLARRSNAMIVVAHCERRAKCHFVLHVSNPFQLPGQSNSILEDVTCLNAKIEPIILDNLGIWYFLDDRLDMIRSASS